MTQEQYDALMKQRQSQQERMASEAAEAKRRNVRRNAEAAAERGRKNLEVVNNPPPLEEIFFVVPGKPLPWQRSGHHGNTHYTPKAMAAHQELVRSHALLAGARKMEGPLKMTLAFIFMPPQTWSQKKQDLALGDGLWPTGRPDLDNLVKEIKDALNGVLYEDDAQIVSLDATKGFSMEPRTGVRVTLYRGQNGSAIG